MALDKTCRVCAEPKVREQYATGRDTCRSCYYAHQRDNRRASARRLYDRRRQEVLDRNRAWRASHREPMRAHSRRAAAERRAGGAFPQPEWEAKFASYDSRCAYCFALTNKLTIDHVVPVALGGTNAIENLVPACWDCNRHKSARPLREWLD